MEGHTTPSRNAAWRKLREIGSVSDRANAARRLMQRNGILEDQVTQVRGLPDHAYER